MIQAKIIFLDVDGVLNSNEWFVSGRKNGFTGSRLRDLDPLAIQRVNNICEKTGAKIVFSSSWRNSEDSIPLLEQAGLTKGLIIDITPTCRYVGGCRGNEIDAWIIDKYGYRKDKRIRYAIIDDDTDMLLDQKDNFFNTDFMVGLTDEMSQSIIEHLNKSISEEVTA